MAPPQQLPVPAARALISEASAPTAEHLVELIAAAGDRAKEEIVEACQLWLKLRAPK